MASPGDINILLLNPNSSSDMTNGMVKALESLALPSHIKIRPYTAPAVAPPSINDDATITASAAAVLDSPPFDETTHLSRASISGILVACYSVHPLVRLLSAANPDIAVAGIFEASVLTSLSLLSTAPVAGRWGIVTTGAFWEEHLRKGVNEFLVGTSEPGKNDKFAGVFTTGLNADGFHKAGEDEIRARLREATVKLLDSGGVINPAGAAGASEVQCVVMGCAGMAGLEDLIREVAIEKYGDERGRKLYVIDGVKAGIGVLMNMIESRRLFRAQ